MDIRPDGRKPSGFFLSKIYLHFGSVTRELFGMEENMRLRIAWCALICGCWPVATVFAQGYPAKPVRLASYRIRQAA